MKVNNVESFIFLEDFHEKSEMEMAFEFCEMVYFDRDFSFSSANFIGKNVSLFLTLIYIDLLNRNVDGLNILNRSSTSNGLY